MKKLNNIILLIMFIAMMTGCTSIPSKHQNLKDNAESHRYHHTNAKDILNEYGKPKKIKELDNGHMHWIYEVKEENVSHWSNYIPVKAFLFGFDTIEDIINVAFTFDENHTLINTRINEKRILHDYGLLNRRFYPSNNKKAIGDS